MKLYICLTYYHSLITMIKCLNSTEQYDILLANDIPGYQSLYKRLSESNVFNKILEYDAVNIRNRRKGKRDIIYYLTDKYIIKRKIEKYCKIDFTSYDDIYVYHDIAEVAKYLVMRHIHYHLLEDALDYFKYFDKYYNVNKDSYTKGTLKFFIKEHLGIGYRMWGSADECIDIEVNSLDGIKISSKKCFSVPRKELFDSLDEKQRVLVFNTFAAGKQINNTTGKTAIVFTQPLFTDHFVESEEDQEKVFERIIYECSLDGYQIVLKPHPRDEHDYTRIINKYNCDYIDKNIPSEVLNFNPEAKYDIAISITSTAINFLEYAQEKRFMGKEYIEKVLENGK